MPVIANHMSDSLGHAFTDHMKRSVWGGSSANRNVWSAALPQAKSDVTGWSAQMYTAFVGVNHSWPGWNALPLFPISNSVSRETSSGYGFGERRVRPLCHLLIRQQTWQETIISVGIAKLQLHQPTPGADMVHSSRG